MTIALRLLAGFAVGVALLLLVGVYALSQIRDVRQETAQIVSRDFYVYRQLDRVRDSQGKLLAQRLQILSAYESGTLRDDPSRLDGMVARWRQEAANNESLLRDAWQGTLIASQDSMTQPRRAAYRDVSATLSQTLAVLRKSEEEAEHIFAAVRSGDVSAAQSEAVNDEHLEAQIDTLLSTAGLSLEGAVAAGQNASGAMYDFSRRSLLVLLTAAVAVAVLVTFWTRNAILGPLHSILRTMERAGQGDLTVRAQASQRIRDELSRLAEGLNQMIDGLADIAGQSRLLTHDLDRAVADMRSAARAQTSSIDRQFGAVRETASSVDAITRSGAEISRHARELIAQARGTIDMSASGLQAAGENARAMSEIQAGGEVLSRNIADLSERTEAIGEIISSVTDLSERSHLLALNAAIEAAAAGEHGRSFGVVAAEMKVLADQSRAATRHVRAILGDVQRGIDTAVTLTEESGKRVAAGQHQTDLASGVIARMASSIETSVLAFQDIAASTAQQQAGIEQVMRALTGIREDSENAASGTRELDGAAAALGELSRQMLVLTERYRV
ncbi:methyl-accepting chemotaxis protein [Tanticharoenia sakaeratensis]|uniref:Ethyl-accepting chemotaxis protein tlpA n=1 Tax=Tanticharoenia sakaeratensis NBRC 103193 TaxID=1231623 RepID=A0A0D6MJS7_9PROT|nr:methyl-accepting chemotaxis protein [Tanticharoenia sakaeratensis]GAN53720.1 ethyl-accepting chemotaxis protein tlpA [Tanticharoenia sakaeratensis NBRC 103193]GBQ17093.1 methyl-accepting chemotaxis sensory transducer [Tanticharoenia sakaeratensis NBRC 103193]